MRIADVIAGAVILLLGTAVIYLSGQLPYEAEYGPGPGFLPLWIGIVLALCGMMAVIKAIRNFPYRTGRFFQPKTRQVGLVLVTLIVMFLLVPVVGLSIGLALFTGFTMRVAGRHGWILCLLVAITTAGSVVFIFGHLLDIPLPKGWIGI
jgi:putative tricarboxylic transport membrane protein